MIASIFLMFVAAGMVVASFVFGFGGVGAILVAFSGLSLLTVLVGYAVSLRHAT